MERDNTTKMLLKAAEARAEELTQRALNAMFGVIEKELRVPFDYEVRQEITKSFAGTLRTIYVRKDKVISYAGTERLIANNAPYRKKPI